MPYTVPDDVRRILRGADQDDDGGNAGDLDDAQILLEIENASSQIDDTLRTVYTVPFDPVPPMIHSLATDIAAYLSDLNYRKSREYESDNYPIIRRYNRARELLEFYRNGNMILPVTRDIDDTSGAVVIHAYDGTLFTVEDIFGPLERDW